jgi:hypothetical protein
MASSFKQDSFFIVKGAFDINLILLINIIGIFDNYINTVKYIHNYSILQKYENN